MNSLLLVATLALSTVVANAQQNRSLQDENRRINNGIATGQLTRGEAWQLKQQTADLREEAYRYRHNDGKIGPRERADLRRDNRKLNRNIYKQKHDCQRRRW